MSKHKYSKEFLERTGIKLDEIVPGKDDEEKPAEPVVYNFCEKAVGMFRIKQTDGGGGHTYHLLEISYDPVHKVTGEIKEVFAESSKEEAVNQFKMRVDELNLFYYDR